MSIVKSFAVGNGDMFYIKHGTDNFTIIDSCMSLEMTDGILQELKTQRAGKSVTRFISTHPDQDHLAGLVDLDDGVALRNFYCVANDVTKPEPSVEFDRYCRLRDDPQKAFHIYRGCTRRWMNQHDENRGSAGIDILWPKISNPDYKAAMASANAGGRANNISCILTYSRRDGATFMWMGDLETDFMEDIQDTVELPEVDILFAPHHGRDSGHVPTKWLDEMNPALIVIGEAPSKHLNYYDGFNTLTQNSCRDITFDCQTRRTHIYVGVPDYSVSFLDDEGEPNRYNGYYIGTLPT